MPRPSRFPYPLTHYAKLYDIPYMTLTKYMKNGWPIDDPSALLEHIRQQGHHNRPPLTNLLRLAKEQQSKSSRIKTNSVVGKTTKKGTLKVADSKAPPPRRYKHPTPAASNDPGEPVSEPDSPEPTVLSGKSAGEPLAAAMEGFQREMQRLSVETNNAYKSYKSAENGLEKQAFWKVWQSMLEQWGKLAKIAPDAEREAGKMAKISDIENTWSRTFKEIRTQLESMKRRISANPTFRSLNPVDVELVIEGEVTRLLKMLAEGDYLAQRK